jgi:hypothetical protein
MLSVRHGQRLIVVLNVSTAEHRSEDLFRAMQCPGCTPSNTVGCTQKPRSSPPYSARPPPTSHFGALARPFSM